MAAFEACFRLASVTIGNRVTTIGEGAFYYCTSLTNVTIPNRVTSIGSDAFGACSSLTSVSIPNSVTSLSAWAFAVCASLTSITIPNNLTNIGTGAFEKCGLTNIIIPASVTSLGTNAFYLCTNLTAACFQGNAPPDNGTVFTNDSRATVYYLPGTTGWGAKFGSRPTALWALAYPVILSGANGNTNLGVRNKQFGFNVSWTTYVPVVVLAATNLTNPAWTPVSTNALTNGTFYFNDSKWTNYPGRFYRLRSP
jgi:hypothetical protein